MVLGSVAYGGPGVRTYPENNLIARPALRVTVGVSDADIVGTDNRAIQAAVDYVGNLGGGTVEIGPGEYLLRDSIHMRTRVTLRGAGERTVLKKAASAYSLLAADGDFGEEAITLEDPAGFDVGFGVWIASKRTGGFHSICATILNRDGNYFTISRPLNADCMMAHEAFAATVFPAISAYHVQEFRIENLVIDGNREENPIRVSGCRGAGIFFYQGDAGVIADCVVRGYNGDGISFQQSNDVQVRNCRVEGNGGGGLHPGSGSQRPVITGCRSIGNDGDGFFFCWRVRHATVENCEFRDNAGVGMSIGHKDSDNVIRGNTIAGNAKGGVYWRKEDEPMAAHRIEFVGNTVENNDGFGLFIDGETNGTVVRGNTIRGTRGGGQTVGIHIGKDAGGVLLEDNTIHAETKLVDERD
ncbi:MAG: hypothetical protein GWP08_05420 [Nitrospiraceae bacterium]|nr:hypothetical protein [Nitrospiraceae bacterium]